MASGTSRSDELLNVGRKVEDPLLITREKPFKLPPPSALSRVRSFLPQLQKANEDLEARISSGKQEDWNIENVANEEPFIEMNLALFEDNNSTSDNEMLHVHNSSSSSSDSDSDSDIGEVTEDNIKLPNQKKGKKPFILEVKMDTNTHEQENKFHNTSSTPELSKNDVQRKESIHLDSASSKTRTSNRQKGKGKSAKKTTRSKTRTRRGRRK